MMFDRLENLISKALSSIGTQGEQSAVDSASRYIDKLNSNITSLASENGIDIFASGDNFKQYITSQTGFSESVFTKSIDELMKLDLSGLSVEKNADDANEEDKGFYSMLNEIYSTEELAALFDVDGDGEIEDSEAKSVISDLSAMDSNANSLSLNDFAALINNLKQQSEKKSIFETMSENISKSFSKLADKMLEQIDIAKNQAALKLPTGGGIASNPYVAPQGSSSAPAASTSADNAQTKEELEAKIEKCNEEISQIHSGEQEAVKSAEEEAQSAKEQMEEQLEKDENVKQETKDEFNRVNESIEQTEAELSQCEANISQKTSELTQGENKLESLENALSSLSAPSGDDEEAQSRYNERKAELESQIDEQKEANEALQQELDELEEQKKELEDTLNEPSTGLYAQRDALRKEIEETCSPETKAAIENYEEKEAAVEEIKTTELARVEGELKDAQNELREIEDKEQEKQNRAATSGFDADFDEMLGYVLGFEGGFSNHPLDNGGATNLGITEATYRAYKNDPNANVANITKEEAAEIYYKNYYQASGAEEYAQNGNGAYAFALFDAAVNHGVGAAKKMDASAQGDTDAFMELRKQKYINIVENNPSQQVFAQGWQNRWNNVYAYIDPNHEYENYI